jgi:hypothetical protein
MSVKAKSPSVIFGLHMWFADVSLSFLTHPYREHQTFVSVHPAPRKFTPADNVYAVLGRVQNRVC